MEEDDQAAQIAEKEIELQYADTAKQAKEAASELARLSDETVAGVEDGAEEYVETIGLNEPGDRQLHIVLRENRLSVSVDGFYALENREIDSTQAGYVFIQSGWGEETYSQRNLADDVYDGVFVDFEVTQSGENEEVLVLYDNKLHGLEWLAHKCGNLWKAVINWFIDTF